ncbi:hypothetical protein [Leifsonia poae]|uniref:hypothetical protein n=1 Tax=Leifsonia poae TaxID=110933 RepID=UPI003D66B4AF
MLSEASAWQIARRLVVTSTDDRLVELEKSVDVVTSAVIALSRALSENVADAADVERMVDRFGGLLDLPTGSRQVKEAYKSVRDAVAVVGSCRRCSTSPSSSPPRRCVAGSSSTPTRSRSHCA